jgi:TRAP-type C4-dicarboxylate transport system permease small subunit
MSVSRAARGFKRMTGAVARAVETLASAMLLAMVLMLGYACVQGIAGWRQQVQWLTEVAEYALLPVGFLGAALAVRRRAHQGIDAVTALLPARWQRGVDAVVWTLVAVFGAVFAWLGGLYVLANIREGGPLVTANLPKWWFYLCYPLSGSLFSLFALEALLDCRGADADGGPASP